ncbi:M4 family metallopeptidase [Pendulispora brunnea]|uniref:Neutral metalloproteinase n=1 Tax=Pendulispora brunnea TaxID=2905690 RepID=A0ABZ2KNQ1_9BACT
MGKRIGLLGLVILGCGSNAGPGDTTEARTQSASLVETLSHESEDAWEWASDPELGTPAHVAGRSAPLLTGSVSAKDATMAFLNRFREQYNMRDPESQFSVTREHRDELGMTHVRLQQVERGIPVQNAEMMAHYDDTGALRTIDSNYVAGLDAVDIVPAFDAERALVRAREELRNVVSDQEARIWTAPELVIHAVDGATPALAYHVVLRTEFPALHRMDYLLDAHTGDVLRAFDDIETMEGTGKGVRGDSKKLQIAQSGSSYILDDRTRTPNGIRTFTANNTENLPGTLLTSTSATSWDQSVESGAGAAVDAHYYAGKVYDYYKTQHGRNGIDGNDGALISVVHFSQNLLNALWDGTQMVYGDGDGTTSRALSASLDVVGHELTHGVTENTSKLVYQKQPGAINESISDIFGSIIEHSIEPNDKNNALLGENVFISGKPFRDLVHPGDPTLDLPQPAHLSKFLNTTQDNGGVHINSGIPNNAFYLMTKGGTNDVSNINVAYGIGWDKAAQLWYRTQTKYLTSSANFSQLANGTLQSATDLKFSQNQKNIIECAWIAVGVITAPSSCRSITAEVNSAGGDAGLPSGKDGGQSASPGNGNNDEDVFSTGKSGCAMGGSHDAAPSLFGGALGLGMLLVRRRIRRSCPAS